jgi:anti-sigma regulatory factor (Ser/Thr protein kinase)
MTAERWSFPAVPGAVTEARRVARRLAVRYRADPLVYEAMALCVSEAVTNAVMHAYRGLPRPGTIELEAKRIAGALCLYVRDRGLGMSPRPDSPGMGLGLPLIAHYAAEFEVRHVSPNGTEIVMRFPVPAAAVA